MKIAIVGAGLAGLALARNLQKVPFFKELHIFDPAAPVKRTSSLAHLLYPFVGLHSRLNYEGRIAFNKSVDLLLETQDYFSSPLFKKTKILKLAHSKNQQKSFQKAAQRYLEITFAPETEFGLAGIWISNVYTVDAQKYLESLEFICEKHDAKFKRRLFQNDDELSYDLIIYTCGYQSSKLIKLPPLSLLKGQGVFLERTSSFNPSHALISRHLHVIPEVNSSLVYVGNTFEKEPEKQPARF